MYREILGFYVTLAGMNWRERKRRANVFPLALGPHAANFADVIRALEPSLRQLDDGMMMTINGVETLVNVHTMAFTGDMVQQLKNSGIMGIKADRSCGKACCDDFRASSSLEYWLAKLLNQDRS